MNEEEKKLEQAAGEFRFHYGFSFKSLITALNEAHISHYSSGCGTKRVTFEIFPAAGYVEEILRMLTLARAFKAKNHNGFRDASAKSDYNPANDFILYLKRWSLFAEQAMRSEGASERGIAAARAKLIMDDLVDSLGERRINPKTGAVSKNISTRFAKLMADIGRTLEARENSENDSEKRVTQQQAKANYLEALEAAGGISRHSMAS